MAARAHKSRISLFSDNSPFLCKSLVSLSLYFSTSTRNIKRPALITCPVIDSLIHKYRFSPQTTSRVASVFAGRRNSKRPDSVLSFLKESGFSNTQLEKIVRYDPRLLSSCLERTIKPKIKIFQDLLDFSASDIAEIFGNDPSIFLRNANKCILPTLSIFKGLFGSNAQVAKLLRRPGWSLFVDVEKILLPNMELLKGCGVPMEQINSFVYTYPYLFLVNPKKMKKSVDKVDKMGVERTSKLFIHAVRVVSSMADSTWKLKLKMFKDLGFSEEDMSRVLRSAPIVLSISRNRIKKVKEILLETGKYDMSCIIKWPASLMYSFEKRYKPRLQVLRVLENKNLIKKFPSLGTLCTMTNEEFFRKFVAPNMKEVGKALIAKTSVAAKGAAENCS